MSDLTEAAAPVSLAEAAAEGFLAEAAAHGIGVTPVELEPTPEPAAEPEGDFNPADPTGARSMIRALDVLLERTASLPELPGIASWKLVAPGPYRQVGIEAQIEQPTFSSYSAPGTPSRTEVLRIRVAQWAEALGGRVIENVTRDYIECEAHGVVGGFQVVAYNHLSPDGECHSCGGPMVGDTVLRHVPGAVCTRPVMAEVTEPAAGAE